MRKGFTLIELLVVIAIIAILAAILFPVFARAREKARQASCLSNCKQMGLAAMQYAQDYDEAYLPGYIDNANGGTRTWYTIWYTHMEPYMKNRQVYMCASAVGPNPFDSSGHAYSGVDYGINSRICPDRIGMKMADVKYPAETLLFADSDCTRSSTDYTTSNAWTLYESFHPSRFIPARHNGGANLVFGDGHAKWHQINIRDVYVGPVKFTYAPTDICWYASGSPKY